MWLSLTLPYKYHDIQPISFSYSFLASSLLIPDKCGNATVASILLFLKKTSNWENLRFDETCQSERVLYNPPDLRLLATLVWSLTLSLANSFFLLWSPVNRSISWKEHFSSNPWLFIRKKIWDSSHHHLIPVWRLHRNERHPQGPPQASVGRIGCAYCDHLNFESMWRLTVYRFLTFQQEFDIETEVKCFAIGKRQSRVIS